MADQNYDQNQQPNQNQQAPYQQQPYQQQPYQPAPYQNPGQFEDQSPLSIGNFLIMILISYIPLVNIIMLFVWGFGNSNTNKKNLARAQLIMLAIGVVISIIFGASIIAAIASLGAGRYY
ncbi:MAG TPA: hypothetical protein VHP31_01885 [Caproicibacter sp.]|nr:hypothetical protein [Caproicibacter sp.]